MELVSWVCPVQTQGISKPASQWRQTTSDWLAPGRFSFFVFKVNCSYDISDIFPGLETTFDWDSNEYFVAGSFDRWDSACYALLNTKSPYFTCEVYRHVYNSLTNLGYTFRGSKSTQAKGFYLV